MRYLRAPSTHGNKQRHDEVFRKAQQASTKLGLSCNSIKHSTLPPCWALPQKSSTFAIMSDICFSLTLSFVKKIYCCHHAALTLIPSSYSSGGSSSYTRMHHQMQSIPCCWKPASSTETCVSATLSRSGMLRFVLCMHCTSMA